MKEMTKEQIEILEDALDLVKSCPFEFDLRYEQYR